MFALVDGRVARPGDVAGFWALPAVALGDCVVETIGVWDGRPFALARHLDRLERSSRMMHIRSAGRGDWEAEVGRALEAASGDQRLRLLQSGDGARMVELGAIPSRARPRSLHPVRAPWIQPSSRGGRSAAKCLSYGPAAAAAREARDHGADDALLVGAGGTVLELPFAGVAWVVGDELRHPSPDLGIVPSTTVDAVADIAARSGLRSREGAWGIDGLAAASELLVLSALRPVVAVEAVGQQRFDAEGPVRQLLDDQLGRARRSS